MTDRHHRNAHLKDTHDLTFDEVNNGDYDETIPLASDFESAMRTAKDATLLLVNRQGSTMYLAV